MSEHTHDFKEYAVHPITRVHKDYSGTAGDKAFLTRKCECGKVQPHSFGPTENMKAELERMLNRDIKNESN